MNQGNARTSASAAVAVTLVLVVLLGVGGLIVLGGVGFLYFRLQARQTEVELMARREAEMAREQAEMARAEAEAARAQSLAAEAERQVGQSPVADQPRRELRLALDAQGTLSVEGQPSDLAKLKDLLAAEARPSEGSWAVVLDVAPETPFEHVAKVQAVCHEAGVTDLQFKLIEP